MSTPIDLNAPYANDGNKKQGTSGDQGPGTPQVNLVGQGIEVLKEGEVADHRKHANGKDISDELAVAAPKRDKDLHPSSTYQGDGDEVDDAEWD